MHRTTSPATALDVRLTVVLAMVLCAALLACNEDPSGPKTGALSIAIDGLPTGVSPSVTLSGLDVFSLVIGLANTIVTLAPGTYTIAAEGVTAAGDRFAASPATQTVMISAGAPTAGRTVTYSVVTARLDVSLLGLPAGTLS